MKNPLNFIKSELEEIKDQNLYRKLRSIQLTSPVHGELAGQKITLFCSNDYLGLSFDSDLKKKYEKIAVESGLGSGAARLISGTRPEHIVFEKEIAKFLGKDSALLYSSGYLANLGVLSGLLGEKDLIVMDKLSHASLIDAAKLSGARFRVYPHGNTKRLDEILSTETSAERKAIVTDSVFSMDGDKGPLKELIRLKKKHNAFLILDEAHGFGVFGKNGKGAAEADKVLTDVDVYIATLSKAVGLIGGVVAGKRELIDYLINRSRTFIYDTALPPAVPAAACLALKKIRSGIVQKRLWRNVINIRSVLKKIGFSIPDDLSPIIPVMIGEEKKALEVSSRLLKKGLFIPAVRYPTVSKGKARLRLTVSAAHSGKDIKLLEQSLMQATA